MRILFVTLFVVLADQITKLYVKGIKIPFLGIDTPGIPYQSSIKVIGNYFKITFIENPGMAFGLQIGGKLFLSLFTIFATILLIIFLFKNRNEGLLLRLSLAFILGGAVGNLIDRIFYGVIYDYAPLFYGRVVDFLHVDFPNFSILGKTIYSWPIFNIADISVTLGFLIIIFGYKKIFHTDNKDEIQTGLIQENPESGIIIRDSEAVLLSEQFNSFPAQHGPVSEDVKPDEEDISENKNPEIQNAESPDIKNISEKNNGTHHTGNYENEN